MNHDRDRWASRDLPVLVHIVNAFDAEMSPDVTREMLADELHRGHDEVEAAVRNLERGRYIADVTWMFGGSFMVGDVTERALRETGLWPNPEQQGDQLLWLLQQKIDQAATPEDQRRWIRIRDAIGTAGRDFAVEMAAALTMRLGG